jgi:hypothetical protein
MHETLVCISVRNLVGLIRQVKAYFFKLPEIPPRAPPSLSLSGADESCFRICLCAELTTVASFGRADRGKKNAEAEAIGKCFPLDINPF